MDMSVKWAEPSFAVLLEESVTKSPGGIGPVPFWDGTWWEPLTGGEGCLVIRGFEIRIWPVAAVTSQ